MATGRDDFVIAITSAFLKKKINKIFFTNFIVYHFCNCSSNFNFKAYNIL